MTKQLNFLEEDIEILKIKLIIEEEDVELVIGSKKDGIVYIPSITNKLLARKIVQNGIIKRFGIDNINVPIGELKLLYSSLYNEIVNILD